MVQLSQWQHFFIIIISVSQHVSKLSSECGCTHQWYLRNKTQTRSTLLGYNALTSAIQARKAGNKRGSSQRESTHYRVQEATRDHQAHRGSRRERPGRCSQRRSQGWPRRGSRRSLEEGCRTGSATESIFYREEKSAKGSGCRESGRLMARLL